MQFVHSHFFLWIRRIWCLFMTGRREGRILQPPAVLCRSVCICSLPHEWGLKSSSESSGFQRGASSSLYKPTGKNKRWGKKADGTGRDPNLCGGITAEHGFGCSDATVALPALGRLCAIISNLSKPPWPHQPNVANSRSILGVLQAGNTTPVEGELLELSLLCESPLCVPGKPVTQQVPEQLPLPSCTPRCTTPTLGRGEMLHGHTVQLLQPNSIRPQIIHLGII